MKSKLHTQREEIIPPNFFDEPIQQQQEARPVPTFEKLARAKINLSNRELAEEIVKRKINPNYFSRRYEPQNEINLDRHYPNHINSQITMKSKYNFPVELLDLNKIFKEMAKIYGGLIDQFKLKHQFAFSAIFDKQTQELEQFISLKVLQSSTWSDIEKYDIERETSAKIENNEMKDKGWRFCKIVSMTIYFYKTAELNGSNYVEKTLRSSAI